MTDPFKTYLQDLQTALAGGDATEHTHRPALKALLEALEPGVTATNEPKKYTGAANRTCGYLRGWFLWPVWRPINGSFAKLLVF